jgi:superfamily II DNA helicase RecQ
MKDITKYKLFEEQAKRHAEVVKKVLVANSIISDGFFSSGYKINSQVVINPNTTVKNETLPEHFSKADIFVTEWRKSTDNIGLIKAVKLLVGMKSKDEILNIGNFLLSMHKPIEFDYQKKYKIAKKEEITKLEKAQDDKIEKPDIETQLKKYRYEVSLSKKIKPYMVFSDKTLSELLAKSPTNLKELEDINGFGPVKVKEYGAAILEILKK